MLSNGENNHFQVTKIVARFVYHQVGMLPKSQVSPRLVERHMAEERAKRTEFLRKFVDTCSAAEVDIQLSFNASPFSSFLIYDPVLTTKFHKV